jgi:hypothetical protein
LAASVAPVVVMSTMSSAVPAARAFHDAVIGDAVAGKEIAREVHVFGRDAHLALVLETERDRDVVEIGHAVHVDPRLRHGHRHVGVAEAQRVDEDDAPIRVGYFFAHEVFAGDAEMHRALRQEIHHFGGRQIRHLHAGEVGDRAAVVAHAARLDQLESDARKERFHVRLQPAFRRHGDDECRAHDALRSAASRSIHTAKPTAAMALALPSRVSNPS